MSKENKRTNHRKIHSIISLITLAIAMVTLLPFINDSYAWLFTESTISNIVKSPVTAISIEERNSNTSYDDGWVDPGIQWGLSSDKFVRMTNSGDSSVVIRVSYSQTWIDNTKDPILYLSNQFDLSGTFEPVATINWTADGLLNSGLWYYGNDGWFYYKKVLAPGESTADIMNSVNFASPTPTGYENAEYSLHFNVESVQYSTNIENQNQLAVWEAFSMTYTEANDILTWSTTPAQQ